MSPIQRFLLLIAFPAFLFGDQDTQIVAATNSVSAIVLTGEGSGRVKSVGTATVVKPNGVLLTAYHVIKDAREVQIRFPNGEVYDKVELLAFDERRDIATIRVPASNLPVLPLGNAADSRPGDAVYTVNTSQGLQGTVASGMFSGIRPAEEVSGAGLGYRLLQISLPANPGASGGPVVNAKGQLIGIITRGAGENVTMAIPVESVIGMTEVSRAQQPFGSGTNLKMPANTSAPSGAILKDASPSTMAKAARSIIIFTKTSFFQPEALARELVKNPAFKSLGLLIVTDRRLADFSITVDRPIFTYRFTYQVVDAKTSVAVFSGRVTAADGEIAANSLAKDIAKRLNELREVKDPVEPTSGKASK